MRLKLCCSMEKSAKASEAAGLDAFARCVLLALVQESTSYRTVRPAGESNLPVHPTNSLPLVTPSAVLFHPNHAPPLSNNPRPRGPLRPLPPVFTLLHSIFSPPFVVVQRREPQRRNLQPLGRARSQPSAIRRQIR